MRYRKLRIAWSRVWVVIALLLCWLWVRSYSWSEFIAIPVTSSHSVSFGSERGLLDAHYQVHPIQRYGSLNIAHPKVPLPERHAGIGWSISPGVNVPHWLAIGLAVLVAALPWVWRFEQFSLRTLLIATTLVAVGLGLIVWLGR